MFNLEDVKKLREQTGAGMLDCKKALEESAGNLDEAVVWLREKGILKAAKKAERIAAEGLTSILIKGNKAVILEINSETDFVAKNEEFKSFVSTVINMLIDSNVKTMDEAVMLSQNGNTINDMVVAITAKIGEKISFRRFQIIEKKDDEVFGEYLHMGGKIGVVVVLDKCSDEISKNVAMHACAMNPKYIRITDVPEEEKEKERKIAKEQAINEGKPKEIAEKMVEGRVLKYIKEISLEEQPYVKDPSITVGTYIKNNNSSIKYMIRYEVGEGIEKRVENFEEEVKKQLGE